MGQEIMKKKIKKCLSKWLCWLEQQILKCIGYK